jgi:hypothetical protein
MDSQGPASVDEEVAALSRGADRDSLFMQAGVMLPGRSDPVVVRVRNLSAGGMLAEGKVQIVQGAAVEIELQAVRRQVVSQSDLPPHLRRTGLEKRPFYRQR